MLTPEELAEIRGTRPAPPTRTADASPGASTVSGAVLILSLVAVVATAGGVVLGMGGGSNEPISGAPSGSLADATATLGPAAAAASATAPSGVFVYPMPLASPTLAPTPAPERRPDPTPVDPAPAAVEPPPRRTPGTSNVTPPRGAPGTVFRFAFTGLPPDVPYLADLIAPHGWWSGRQPWQGTVPSSGVLALSWHSPLDAPTGLWQLTLIAGRAVEVVPFQLAR